MSLHENFHRTYVKKHVGIVLTIFRKAYNKVKCDFLLGYYAPRGFDVT